MTSTSSEAVRVCRLEEPPVCVPVWNVNVRAAVSVTLSRLPIDFSSVTSYTLILYGNFVAPCSFD